MSRKQKPTALADTWKLTPLTPGYIGDEHQGYVAAIEAALADPDIRNIALSGNYGVGKSSILQAVADRQKHRVVELSLSTLSPIEAKKIDDAVPVQATTPTNRIQQEIVKQLLYREDPRKTPASRFRRIERFRWLSEIGVAALLGLVIAVIFLLTGWTAQIVATFAALDDLGAWTHLIVWGVAAAGALMVRRLFYGRLRIKELSAGSATVTLDDNSVSYFDQYLDEIVYFFDVSGRDVVIFEDIDRFNDSHIFETLRALNTLLNASPQVDKPIRFIYAIKDSIFDRIGLEAEGRNVEPDASDDPAKAETVRANRTKFFDLVIPVVPFITHRSARNLATQLLDKIDHKVESELLDLATQYVPDMRLLKNVRNEFVVFRDRIFSGDGKQLDLDETDMFAMMLYKSTHLTDFEKIRLGTSALDTLYKVSRELVTENIKRIDGERRVLRQKLGRINGATTRSAQLGDRLLAHVQRTAQAIGARQQNSTMTFNGTTQSVDDLKSADFWTDFVEAEAGDAVLRWSNTVNYNRYLLSFTRDNLVPALGDPLDAASWNAADRAALVEQIEEKTEEIAFLRSADLGDLVKRPELLVKHDEVKRSFSAVAEALLKPGLAYQLVRAGHINRNFTLYTSTFHGDRVSPAATNFIIHHVERDLMDEHFVLDPSDVDALVRERGKSSLKEPALYNIAILDRLLASDTAAADIMIRALVTLEESQARFVQSFLTAGERRQQFIERFTGYSTRVLQYLVTQADLDDEARLELVNVVLSHCTEHTLRLDAPTMDYLKQHHAEFEALTSDTTDARIAERLGALFLAAGTVVPTLQPLGAQIRASFVSRNLYEVTRENLLLAIGGGESIALDVLRAADGTVYDYVLEHLSAYLDAARDASNTVDQKQDFIPVLEDVLKHDSSRIGDVVASAAPECGVEDLAEVSDGAWPALAAHLRFPATFNNVNGYIASQETIDQHLAGVLADAGTITEADDADDDTKVALSISILAASDLLPSPELRAGLVASIDPSEHLEIASITAENGELFALLLTHNLIEDDAVVYAHLTKADWATRRSLIQASAEFANYITPGLVWADLPILLTSPEIDASIKRTIIEQADAYVEVAGPRGLAEIARYATANRYELSLVVVQKLAEENIAAAQIVMLLEPHLSVATRAQLFEILTDVGGVYAQLTAVGYDKPKVPNTTAYRALLERLKSEGIVNSYNPRDTLISVNKRRK